MPRAIAALLPVLFLLYCPAAAAAAGTDNAVQPQAAVSRLHWNDNYTEAWEEAERSGKMMLVWFCGDQPNTGRDDLQKLIDRDANVQDQLGDYVLVKLSTDARLVTNSESIRILDHDSFTEMHGREGLAIIDLADPSAETHGHVVSAFPIMKSKYYQFRASYLPVILDLPRGSITERTMIWAVRVHPERPASTDGDKSHTLADEARSHSRHQARILVQGHHQWESRFHRIIRRLGGRGAPTEVVAESWPNQNMIDSCIDCVDSWRQSSGHWNAVAGEHSIFAYDIRRGSNGIWYGTGLFASF